MPPVQIPGFISPALSEDEEIVVDADLNLLEGPYFTVSYSMDHEVADAVGVPDGEYDRLKSGWDKHLKLLQQRDVLRHENLNLKQRVTCLRNDVKRANAQYASLEEEYDELKTDLISARRDAHVYLVELYKVTGSVTLFKDDEANRRALEDAQEWLHREATRAVKAEMKARGATDRHTFHALVHMPAPSTATPQPHVTSS